VIEAADDHHRNQRERRKVQSSSKKAVVDEEPLSDESWNKIGRMARYGSCVTTGRLRGLR
jgi:hypothetical protein